MFRFIVSCLVVLPHLIMGQKLEVDLPENTSKYDAAPSAVRVGLDLFGIANTLVNPDKTKFELQGDLDFDKYFVNLDIGRESTQRIGENYNYESAGNYLRIGVDANLMPYNKDRSVIFLGGRYATTSYNDKLTYNIPTDIWNGNEPLEIDQPRLSARWVELVAGMKVRVMQGFYLGYTGRYKIYKRVNGADAMDSYDIPGYGLGSKNTNLDFSFYMYYRLSFRYKPVPIKPPKKRKQAPPSPVNTNPNQQQF